MESRDALLAQVQKQLQEDVAWAPVVQYDNQWISAPGLSGLVLHPDNSVHFMDLELTN